MSHNLGKYPAVSIIDGTSETIICEVVYDSLNVCTLTFNEQFTGKAIFN